jgi:hypothetical protein
MVANLRAGSSLWSQPWTMSCRRRWDGDGAAAHKLHGEETTGSTMLGSLWSLARAGSSLWSQLLDDPLHPLGCASWRRPWQGKHFPLVAATILRNNAGSLW